MLLLLFRVPFDYLQILLGLLAFLVSYSSVYVLNDLYDEEEDKMDERKIQRKPIARGAVNRDEAIVITGSLLSLGLLLSLLVGLLFLCVTVLLVFLNLIYSILSDNIRKQSLEDVHPKSLKHTNLGLALVTIMQILKIFLPWTFGNHLLQFPVLFAIGLSFIYAILFKGYKEYLTIGQSVIQAPFFFGFAGAFFISSVSLYPEPFSQASIVVYILAGIVLFRNSHLTERRVLLLSPVYIFLGIILLFVILSGILWN
jgi:hypothetical protein